MLAVTFVAFIFVQVCWGLEQPGGSNIDEKVNQTLVAILQENTDLKHRISILEAKVASQLVIGFSVALTQNRQLGNHQAIEYDRIITNIGNVYDKSTGHFTAPVHGLYQFATTVSAVGSNSIHVQILKNGDQIATTYAENGGWDNGTIQTVVELEAGDLVWVIRYEPRFAIQTIHGYSYSTFSGALIKQM